MGASLIMGGLGLAGSLISSRNNSRAIDSATQTQERALADQNALNRYIFDTNRQDLAPFRQTGINQANFWNEIMGFDNVGGQPQQGGGVTLPGGGTGAPGNVNVGPEVPGSNGLRQNEFPQFARSQPQTAVAPGGAAQPQARPADFGGFNPNGNNFNAPGGNVTEPGLPTGGFNFGGTIPGGTPTGGGSPPQSPNVNTGGATLPNEGGGVQQGTVPLGDPGITMGPTVGPGFNGADRFNNSLFNAVFTNDFNRDRSRVQSNLANSGLLYSGVTANAIENSRANNFQNALQQYLNFGLGAPTQGAIQMGVNNNNQYAANTNALTQQGANFAGQSAFARADNNNNLVNNLFNTGAYALGAFS